MPREKERTAILAENVRMRIKTDWPTLSQAMRDLELTDALTTDAFYRIIRGDLSTPHEVQLIQTRWVFKHKNILERELVEQALQSGLELIREKTGKNMDIADLVRDIIIYNKKETF